LLACLNGFFYPPLKQFFRYTLSKHSCENKIKIVQIIFKFAISTCKSFYETSEDTKGVIKSCKSKKIYFDFDLIFGVLTPLSAIFQLYHGDQF
jgi:hypothetical protein